MAMSDKRKKILLLDDDYESMHGLKSHLEEEFGWDVELSAEKRVLERFCQERFDLIVVDSMIHPPSMGADKQENQNIHYDGVKWDRTGLEFLRRLRAGEYTQKGRGTSSGVPAIVLSAVADSAADGEWGKILKNEHYTEKPFRLSDLVNLMRSLLQE
jgi:CheY-like chemotaxis protein